MTAGAGNRTRISRSRVSTLNHWTTTDSISILLNLELLIPNPGQQFVHSHNQTTTVGFCSPLSDVDMIPILLFLAITNLSSFQCVSIGWSRKEFARLLINQNFAPEPRCHMKLHITLFHLISNYYYELNKSC